MLNKLLENISKNLKIKRKDSFHLFTFGGANNKEIHYMVLPLEVYKQCKDEIFVIQSIEVIKVPRFTECEKEIKTLREKIAETNNALALKNFENVEDLMFLSPELTKNYYSFSFLTTKSLKDESKTVFMVRGYRHFNSIFEIVK